MRISDLISDVCSSDLIEAARLADDLGVSVTPVRDSLYRLNGERMVDFAPGEGFHVHRLTETEFRDLLELHLILLLAALATAPTGSATSVPADQPYPDRIADLFLAIAERSANSEIVASTATIGGRPDREKGVEGKGVSIRVD